MTTATLLRRRIENLEAMQRNLVAALSTLLHQCVGPEYPPESVDAYDAARSQAEHLLALIEDPLHGEQPREGGEG